MVCATSFCVAAPVADCSGGRYARALTATGASIGAGAGHLGTEVTAVIQAAERLSVCTNYRAGALPHQEVWWVSRAQFPGRTGGFFDQVIGESTAIARDR